MALLEELKTHMMITDKEIYDNAIIKNQNGLRTSLKEIIGDRTFANVYRRLFPNAVSFTKIKDLRLQKSGIDYIVTLLDGKTYNIDIKSCVGSAYVMKPEDYISPTRISSKWAVPIELTQNGKKTNTEDKLTDYMVYIIHDELGTRVFLFDYSTIMDLSTKEDIYTKYTSNNGSGEYIKVPAKKYAATSIIQGE